VAHHGREALTLVNGCALILSVLAVPQTTPPPFPFQDLVPELVEKIAASVAPAQQVQLAAPPGDDADRLRARQLERDLSEKLTARGLRIVDRTDGVPIVTVTCGQNLRERACAAEIRKGGMSQIVTATRPHDTAQPPPASPVLALDVRTVFTHRTPILDVAMSGDRLFVLEPAALTRYQRRDNEWLADRSRPISSVRVPPRDVRGRLRLDGTTVDALLPGVVCRANVDSLNLTCADEQQAWPLGVENTGLAVGRNYFTTPEGLAFYGAASLTPEADARWLVTAPEGRLLFLDSGRRALESAASASDDVAAVDAACSPGSYVILSARAGPGTGAEALQLFEVIGRRLVPAASPVILPGPLTALWAAPGARTATAVSRDTSSGRYAAFQIAIICSR
jgi:hypothetical protein